MSPSWGSPVPWIKWSLARFGLRLTRLGDTNDLDSHLLQVFLRLGINCVLDVGAHRGEYGAGLRRLGYRGRIVSFEPVPENYAALSTLCAADRDWRAYPFALGDREGQAEINVMAGSTFSSFLIANEYGKHIFAEKMRISRRQNVELKRLDTVFDECVSGIAEPCVFLKTDTQGLDLTVIEGAGSSLSRVSGLQAEATVRPIYQGMSNPLAETLTALEKQGFGVTGLFPVTRDPSDRLRVIEFDCVMCRPPR